MNGSNSHNHIGNMEKETKTKRYILSLSIFFLFATVLSPEVLLVPEHYSRFQDALVRAKDGDTLSVHLSTPNDPTAYRPVHLRGKSVEIICRGPSTQSARVYDVNRRRTEAPWSSVDDSEFIRGDVDIDDDITMSDAIFILTYKYIPGGSTPSCMDAADVDDNGEIKMSDAIYLLRYLYVPGSAPPPPPFLECEIDPTPDTLSCSWYPPCYWVGQGQVNELDTLFDAQPRMDMDPNGNPWVVWMGRNDAGYLDVFERRWNGSSWGPEGFVGTPDADNDYKPTIAFMNGDTAFVTWDHETVTGDIWYSRWNGSSWGPRLPVYASDSSYDYSPVVSSGGDEVWVVWYGCRQNHACYYHVFASRWNGSGWDSLMQISTPDSTHDWWADVDVDSTGRPHVVYCAYFTGGVYYSTYIDSSWTYPALVSDTAVMQGYDPAIVVDDSGGLHVVWTGIRLDHPVDYDIYYSYSLDGTNWIDAIIVNEDDNVSDGSGEIAVTSPEDIWCVWDKEYSLWNAEVFVSHFDGLSWAREFRLNNDSTMTHLGPATELDGNGKPWVIWTGMRDLETHMEIYFNRVHSDQ